MNERELTCICCPLGCSLLISQDEQGNIHVTGNSCPRGAAYGEKEVTNPTRVVTSSVKVRNGSIPQVSVKTKEDIPKEKIFDVMQALRDVVVEAPVHIGDVIIENVAETGTAVLATKSVEKQ